MNKQSFIKRFGYKLLPVILIATQLTACVTYENSSVEFTINQNGKTDFAFDFKNIKSDEKGQKAVKELTELDQQAKNNAILELGNKSYISNYQENLGRDDKGQLNGKATGTLASPKHIAEMLDSSIHQYKWIGSKLMIQISRPDSSVGSLKSNKSDLGMVTFRTKGRFAKGTSGQVSADRQTVTFKGDETNNIVLVIEGVKLQE